MTSDEHDTPRTVGDLAGLIDHTLLRPEAGADAIEQVCGEAVTWRFRTVCVNPVWVSRAAARLRGTGVGVSSVVAFPFGASVTEVKVHEAERALADGAAEIDMVVNLGALKSGELDLVRRDLDAVVALCRERDAVCKAILELAVLTQAEKLAAGSLAVDAGVDFVKTSTGFGPGGASIADVALLRRIARGRAGIKASGGIRDLSAALAMLAAGATRLGTSSSVRILEEARAAGMV
jgi:deoxyribose-phosphate aldolase